MSKHGTDKPQDVTDELLNEKLPLDREPFSDHGEAALKELELLMLSRERILNLLRQLDEETATFDNHDRLFTGHVLLSDPSEMRRLTREISGVIVATIRKLRKG